MLRRVLLLLAKAAALGTALGVALWAMGLSGSLRVSLITCLTFAGVMWGGFECLQGFYRPRSGHPPQREALRAMGRSSLLYLALLAVGAGLVRLFTGLNLAARPAVAALTFALGFAVTHFMMARHALANLLEAEQARLRAEARAGLMALQAQLQPHTLFNALNTIAALIPEEPAKAEAATEALSRLLRRVTAALEREHWTLTEEFALLEDLLALEGWRFGPRLASTLCLSAEEGDRCLPPLLLLPLVENALKHGFRPKVGPCHLEVVAEAGVVRITDNGVGRVPDAPEGLGLRTVRERLAQTGGRLAWPSVATGCAVEVHL